MSDKEPEPAEAGDPAEKSARVNDLVLQLMPMMLSEEDGLGKSRSVLRQARKMIELAREQGRIQPLLLGLFWVTNKCQSMLDSQTGIETAIELISLVESEERARLIEPNLDSTEYAETIAWMTSCAYDNLAEHTGRRDGYNSPGIQACVNGGMEVCRRVGNTDCVACFRRYSVEVFRAGDDLDMALHYARQVTEIPATARNAFLRGGGATAEGDILLLRGLLEPAQQAYERARQFDEDRKHPRAADVYRETLSSETLGLLAGRLAPDPAGLFPRQLETGENPHLDLQWDLRDALAHALRQEWQLAEQLLIPWDRRLRSQVKDLWFEVRLRLMALDRLRGNERRFERLAEDTREVATEACDWLTISRIDYLSSPNWVPNPYPSLAPLRVGAEPAAAGATPTDTGESALAKPGLGVPSPGSEDEIPETPLKERLSQLAERLPQEADTPQAAASVAHTLLEIDPAEVTHPYEAGWMLHLMSHVAEHSGDLPRVWRWAQALHGRYPNDGRVINTFATLANRFLVRDWEVPGRLGREALEALYRRSLDLEPHRSRNFARAAQFFVDHNNFSEAERCLARSFRLDRTSPLVAGLLAELYEHSQRPRDALAVIDMALRSGCAEPQICWRGAMLAFSLDQFEALRTYLDRYEELQPGEPWTQHYRALALYELRDYPAARLAAEEEQRRNADQPAGSLLIQACISAKLEESERLESELNRLLGIPLREINYLTAQGFTGLYGRLWRATRGLGLVHPQRRRLLELLLQSGLAPDELFEEIAPQRRPGSVSLYRCVLRQPLDERWKTFPGCLPGQEAWTNYDAIWGVLAHNEEEATRLARRMQFRCFPLANEMISVESSRDEFADFARVVWQGMRYVEDLPEEIDRLLEELNSQGESDTREEFGEEPEDDPDRPPE